MSEKTAEIIREFGDQAYYKAVAMSVVATTFGDREGAEMFATSARELMAAGYHKHPEQKGSPNARHRTPTTGPAEVSHD